MTDREPITYGEGNLRIGDIVRIARGARVILSTSPVFRERLARGAEALDRMWRENRPIYGVTTGVGDSCGRSVPEALINDFSLQISRFHGCGMGRHFDEPTTAAILAVQLSSLSRGFSAVRVGVLEHLCELINRRLLPRIPEEGSVGASGDLTPLSYVAAVLMGEREVWRGGVGVAAREALHAAGLKPLQLGPKEALALMNGTAVMTGIACLALDRARYLMRLGSRLAAMVCETLLGNKSHFNPAIFRCKPHPGQGEIAAWIAADLRWNPKYQRSKNGRIQDTYAVRCAPHILGVLNDAFPWMTFQVETELNSAGDNPLIDPNSGQVLHGGNFYGGHMAFAMDALKTAVANVADLMDRQMALLVNQRRNRGLPPNLSGAASERLPVNHGFKAVQIACSAWTAEALKLTMPASVFSRSTESHNQDKVSMGTIAARDVLRVLELTEQVLAATLLGACQALDLRLRGGELTHDRLSAGLLALHTKVREISDFVTEDRPLEADLRALVGAIRDQAMPGPEEEVAC